MAILVVSSSVYVLLGPDKPEMRYASWAFQITASLRVIGFVMVALYMALYEEFHYLSVSARMAEMKAMGLYNGMQMAVSSRSPQKNYLSHSEHTVQVQGSKLL